MAARVGIRVPSLILPFLILHLLIIQQSNNTVLCASFIISLFLQSLQQDLASSSHPITPTKNQ